MDAFVEVRGLRIVTDTSAPGGAATLVHDVSFAIPRGEVLALIERLAKAWVARPAAL